MFHTRTKEWWTIFTLPKGALAQKALKHLERTGLADTAFFGAEPEFFIFDDVRYNSSEGGCFYSVDTIEAPWNTGRVEEGGNLAYKIQIKEGYFPVAPNDTAQDIRSSTRNDVPTRQRYRADGSASDAKT